MKKLITILALMSIVSVFMAGCGSSDEAATTGETTGATDNPSTAGDTGTTPSDAGTATPDDAGTTPDDAGAAATAGDEGTDEAAAGG